MGCFFLSKHWTSDLSHWTFLEPNSSLWAWMHSLHWAAQSASGLIHKYLTVQGVFENSSNKERTVFPIHKLHQLGAFLISIKNRPLIDFSDEDCFQRKVWIWGNRRDRYPSRLNQMVGSPQRKVVARMQQLKETKKLRKTCSHSIFCLGHKVIDFPSTWHLTFCAAFWPFQGPSSCPFNLRLESHRVSWGLTPYHGGSLHFENLILTAQPN